MVTDRIKIPDVSAVDRFFGMGGYNHRRAHANQLVKLRLIPFVPVELHVPSRMITFTFGDPRFLWQDRLCGTFATG